VYHLLIVQGLFLLCARTVRALRKEARLAVRGRQNMLPTSMTLFMLRLLLMSLLMPPPCSCRCCPCCPCPGVPTSSPLSKTSTACDLRLVPQYVEEAPHEEQVGVEDGRGRRRYHGVWSRARCCSGISLPGLVSPAWKPVKPPVLPGSAISSMGAGGGGTRTAILPMGA
jgi:hypothetical protein